MTLIQPDDNGQRLDRFLKKKFPDLTFGNVQKLLRTGQIRVDGKRAKPDTKLETGQELRLPPMLLNAPDKRDKKQGVTDADRAFIKKLVIHQDDAIIAINKPAGLAVQGGTKTTRHVDGLLEAFAGPDGVKPRLVHRIDRDTSGVLIVARTAEAARMLMHQFQRHEVRKIYWAITSPTPGKREGRIDAKLAKAQTTGDLEKMIHDPEKGQIAITDYRVLDQFGDQAALVEFMPETGRTHQIRVHASLIGAPLLGDPKYGPKQQPLLDMGVSKGLHLHARSITFQHPQRKKTITIKAPVEDAFLKTCRALSITLEK